LRWFNLPPKWGDTMRIDNMTQNLMTSAQTQKVQADDEIFKARLESAMSEKDKGKLRKVCQDFESVFLNMMLQSMRDTVPKSDLLGQDKGREMFEGMLDQEITKNMAKAGGVGLADMMFRQLTINQTNPASVKK
jgi:peptidoglycan hydrolase FlgJ